MKKEGRGGR